MNNDSCFLVLYNRENKKPEISWKLEWDGRGVNVISQKTFQAAMRNPYSPIGADAETLKQVNLRGPWREVQDNKSVQSWRQ